MSSKFSKLSRRLARVLTTLPKDIDYSSLFKYTGVGSGVGLLGALLLTRNKKNRVRNAVVGSFIGGALGGYTNLVKDNLISELGGHFTDKPEHYDTDKLLDDVKKHNHAKNEVVLYVPGADDLPGGKKWDEILEDDKRKGVYTYGWGDYRYLKKAINALHEAGYTPHIVAHSAGGTAAISANNNLSEKLGSITLLDPVDFNIGRLIGRHTVDKIFKRKKLKNSILKRVFVPKHRPEISIMNVLLGKQQIPENQRPDFYVANNPFLVDKSLAPEYENILVDNDNHAMYSTGLRRFYGGPDASVLVNRLKEDLSKHSIT